MTPKPRLPCDSAHTHVLVLDHWCVDKDQPCGQVEETARLLDAGLQCATKVECARHAMAGRN